MFDLNSYIDESDTQSLINGLYREVYDSLGSFNSILSESNIKKQKI